MQQTSITSRLGELFSDTAVYGLSSVVARFLGYLLVPFYTSFFNPAEYGVVGLIYVAIVFLNVIFTFGMESSYIRHATERSGSKDVYKTLQITILIVGTILALLMVAGSGWVQPLMSLEHHDADTIYLLMIGILWFDALGIVPFAELRLVRKSYTYASIRIVNVLINLVLNIYLVAVLSLGIEAVLWSNFIASSLSTVVLWFITRNQLKGKFSRDILHQALLFGLPYVPNGIGFAINEGIDRYFLNAMSGEDISRIYEFDYSSEEITGIYNACYKLAVFMLLGVQMFRMAWQPFFMKHASDADNPELFAKVFDWYNVFSAGIFLTIALFAVEIAAINVPILNDTLINSRYWEGLSIVPILLLAYWFQGWFVNFSAGIFIKDKTAKLPAITLVGATITLTLNFLLVPFIGMIGSAFATLVCYAVMSLILLHYSQKSMYVNYRVWRALIIMIFCGILIYLGTETNLSFVTSLYGRLILLVIGVIFVFSFNKTLSSANN